MASLQRHQQRHQQLNVNNTMKKHSVIRLLNVVVLVACVVWNISSSNKFFRTLKAADSNGKQRLELIPLFIIWLGDRNLTGLHAAAVESCRRTNADHFDVRLIRNEDVDNLGFPLHDLFYLLDSVQKSDYLRQELLHHHGGFYLDADVFCIQPLHKSLEIFKDTHVLGGGGKSQFRSYRAHAVLFL